MLSGGDDNAVRVWDLATKHRPPGGPSRPGRARARARKGHVAAATSAGCGSGLLLASVGSGSGPPHRNTALRPCWSQTGATYVITACARLPHPGTQRASEGERRIHACARVRRDGGVVRQQNPAQRRGRSVRVSCLLRACRARPITALDWQRRAFAPGRAGPSRAKLSDVATACANRARRVHPPAVERMWSWQSMPRVAASPRGHAPSDRQIEDFQDQPEGSTSADSECGHRSGSPRLAGG
jgi:hypothetical protein